MGCAAWVLSELKAEESFLTVSPFVLPFFLALAALTFFFSSSSAHWQGIHLRKLHLSAAPTQAGLAAGDASLSVWLAVRHLYHLKDFPPISFFAFLLILFFLYFFLYFFFFSAVGRLQQTPVTWQLLLWDEQVITGKRQGRWYAEERREAEGSLCSVY